jgi:hypothetical protein
VVPANNHHHYALVVGINEYPSIGSLTKPTVDAREFHKWLINPNLGGLDPEHCETEFQDVPYPGVGDVELAQLILEEKRRRVQPKADRIKEAFLRLEAKGNTLFKNDPGEWQSSRLYLYFAGHGMAVGRHDADLFLADAGPSWYGNRAPCEYILNHLTKVHPAFREVVFFADCCRSIKGTAGPATFSLDSNSWPSRGTIIGASCYATLFNDPSYESVHEDGRGFFSQALLEGLNGCAAPVGDKISTENLRIWVQDRLKQLTERVPGGPQSPDFHAPQEIVLLHRSPGSPADPALAGPGPVANTVSVRFIRFTGVVRLHGPDDVLIGEIPAFNAAPGAVWNLPNLQNVIHRIVVVAGDGSLLQKGGFFSWRDMIDSNGFPRLVEM